jgi:hypothetical protein
MSLPGIPLDFIDDAVQRSINAGVTSGVAAGTNATGGRRSRTSGPADLFAPRVNVTSAWVGATEPPTPMSGTSMASPHVTGVSLPNDQR